MKITREQIRKIIRENMQANMQMVEKNIKLIAAELINNPGSAATLLKAFPPAIELDKHLQSMEGGLRMDDFLDKIEKDLQFHGVDRVTAIKFADSFLQFK